MLRKWSMLLLFLIAAIVTGCNLNRDQSYVDFRIFEYKQTPKQSVPDFPKPLRFAVAPVLSHKETIGYYRMIVEHLAIQTGRPTELIQRQSNAEVNVLLANGGADIALFSTGTYVSYNETEEIEPLVMQQRNGIPYYYAYVVVSKASNIATIDDLQGKSFAFTDPLSYSGHLAVVELLKDQGKTPEGFFGRYQYTYSHLKALKAVANRVVDGAAIDSLAYDYAKLKEADIAAAIRVITVSPPIGTGPVVVRNSMPLAQKELIRSIFLNMHHNADMMEALDGLMIERFIMPQANFYQYPYQTLKKVRARL